MLPMDVSILKVCEHIKRHVRNKNKHAAYIIRQNAMEETIELLSEYHKTMQAIGIPHDKHNTF